MSTEELIAWMAEQERRRQEELAANPPKPILVTNEILYKIEALSECTFLPASYEKRFVRSIQSKKLGDELSLKQAEYLYKLFVRYRRQHGRMSSKP